MYPGRSQPALGTPDRQPRIRPCLGPTPLPALTGLKLRRLWSKFVLSGEVDAQHPSATTREAYNQVVTLHIKDMRETAEAICTDFRLLEADMLASQGPPAPATCARCGARSLMYHLTARESGATYCPECVEQLEKQTQPAA